VPTNPSHLHSSVPLGALEMSALPADAASG
jgi:hypothetical protein